MRHLRHMAVAVLALCLLGGGTVPESQKPPRQTDDPAAVKALKPLADIFDTDSQGRVETLGLGATTNVKNDDLRHLAGLAALQTLFLCDDITDAGLDYVGKARTLKDLTLGEGITDAGLKHLRPLSDLTTLNCDCPKVTDAGLVHLKGMAKLEALSLQNTAVTDAGLVHLKNMSDLWRLDLSNTRITDAGLEHLKALHNLSNLVVKDTGVTAEGLRKFLQAMHRVTATGPGQTPRSHFEFNPRAAQRERTRKDDDPAAVLAVKLVAFSMEMDDTGCVNSLAFGKRATDNDLQHLAGLAGPERLYFWSAAAVSDAGLEHVGKVKTLVSLSLDGIPITSAGLKHLKSLRHMSHLNLNKTKIDDRGLEQLSGMEKLYNLSLSGTAVTDAGLKHLQRLPSLQHLNLSHTGVTDAGLANLKDIPRLDQVNLIGTHVTAAGAERLKKDRPQLEVELTERPSRY